MKKRAFPGLHRVRRKLADGTQQIYCYAWRGGPLLKDGDGRPLSEGTPEFHVAYGQARGTLQRQRAPDTVGALISEYKATSAFAQLRDSTKRDYLRVIRRLEIDFGTMPIAALDDRRVRGVFKDWRDGMAETPRSADYHWTVLARILAVAKDRGRIGTNPCERGGRLHDGDRADRIWSEEDLGMLFAVCSREIRAAVIMALWTGQRQGDLLKVTWSAYEGGMLRLRQGKGGRRVSIPAGPTLAQELALLPRRATQILTSSEGTPWTSDGFRASFGKAKERAGVKGLTFHDLRGTSVTRLSIAGCTPQEIATITGHSLRDVDQILDRHYLSRDLQLAEAAILKLERHQQQAK